MSGVGSRLLDGQPAVDANHVVIWTLPPQPGSFVQKVVEQRLICLSPLSSKGTREKLGVRIRLSGVLQRSQLVMTQVGNQGSASSWNGSDGGTGRGGRRRGRGRWERLLRLLGGWQDFVIYVIFDVQISL